MTRVKVSTSMLGTITMKSETQQKTCYRTACDQTEGITYYNNMTKGYYCLKCARKIQWETSFRIFDDIWKKMKEAEEKEKKEKLEKRMVSNPINQKDSWYSSYLEHPKSTGTLLHYVNVIAGLQYAEVVTIGDGIIKYHDGDFATFTWDGNENPVIVFDEKHDWMNERQKEILEGKE
jgi:hypothetical protein